MTASDVIAGWSAGLAMLFVCGAVLTAWTAQDMLRDDMISLRRTVFVACVATFLTSLAWWQADASYRWILGEWHMNTLSGTSFGWRALATLSLFGLIGTTSFPRCGHRGWIVSLWAFALTTCAAMWYARVT